MSINISSNSAAPDLTKLREAATRDTAPVKGNDQKTGEAQAGKTNKAHAEKMAAADAALVGFVVAAKAGAVQGVTGSHAGVGASAQAVQLAPPKVSAETPQVAQTVIDGVKREQDKLAEITENPGVAIAVGSLLQQFSAPAKAEAKQDSQQLGRAEEVALAGVSGGLGKAAIAVFGGGSAERAFSAILQVGLDLKKSNQTEHRLEADAEKRQYQANQAGMAALENQGRAMKLGAISSGISSGVGTAIGAGLHFKGAKTRVSSIEKNVVTSNKLRSFNAGQETVKVGMPKPMAGEELGDVEISGNKHSLEGSGGGLAGEHERILSEQQPAREAAIHQHDTDHQRQEIRAGNLRTYGDVARTVGEIGAKQADGVAGMTQKHAAAQETLARNDQEVASGVADAHRKTQQQINEMTEKLLAAAESVSKDQAGVASQVAAGVGH